MINIEKCIICDSENISQKFTCKDHYYSKENFEIFECKSCGFRFTNPIPDEEKIGDYYKSEEYLSHNSNNKSLFSKIYFSVRNITIKNKFNIINKHTNGKTILDIGCGTAEVLNYCNSKGYKVTGLEPSEDARKFATENHKIDIFEPSHIDNLPDNKFDIITMWHVYEHIYNLKDFTNKLKRILKLNGTLLIAVPINTSYDAKLYKENWAAYDVPRHIYHFNPEILTKYLSEFNFKFQKKYPMKFDSYYVSMLSEKYKTGKMNLFKSILVGFKSNFLAKFYKEYNYSSEIFIFKNNND